MEYESALTSTNLSAIIYSSYRARWPEKLFGIQAWELVERVMGYESQQEEDWQMESHDLRALFEITLASLLYCPLPVVECTLTARLRTLPTNTDI
jgi:hypothetical protein